MTVHIVTDELVVLSVGAAMLDEDGLLDAVNGVLTRAGLREWSSAEAEAVCGGEGVLLFVKPVRVFIPKLLQLLERG